MFIAFTACSPDTVSDRTAPRVRALDQCRRDRGGAERPLLVGDDRHDRRHRVVAGRARLLRGEPGPRPQQELVGREVGGRGRGGACGGIHTWTNDGLSRPELLGVEPGVLELARREVDDDDVGARRELRARHRRAPGRSAWCGSRSATAPRPAPARRTRDRRGPRARRTRRGASPRSRPAGATDRSSTVTSPNSRMAPRSTSGVAAQEFPMVCSSMLAIFLRASSRLAGSHSDGHRPSTGL